MEGIFRSDWCGDWYAVLVVTWVDIVERIAIIRHQVALLTITVKLERLRVNLVDWR